MQRPAIVLATIGAVTLLAACGSHSDAAGNKIHGKTLTIYSSGPLHGASSARARAALEGEQLALAQSHGRIGQYRVVLRALDDSTPQRGEWDPGQTTVNAKLAIQDPSTIAYLGELNSGASAVSIPLLNRVGIPQISSGSSAVGLTSAAPGAAPGEPQKYYPTGQRTFARIVPNDTVEANVQVELQQSMGCRETYVLDDGEVDGEDFADTFQLVARSSGLDVIGVQAFQPRASTYAPLAASIASTGADCVLISALPESGAPLLARQIAAGLPHAAIFGSAPLADSSFTDPADGGIPLAIDSRVTLTAPPLVANAGPALARAFRAVFERRYGAPRLDAIYGYEAMSLLLSAIATATDGGRQPALRSKVRDAIFDTRARPSLLGSYGITDSGDTTIRRYGVYRIVSGNLRYWTTLSG